MGLECGHGLIICLPRGIKVVNILKKTCKSIKKEEYYGKIWAVVSVRENELFSHDLKGASMLNDWLFIGVFLVLAPVFPALALIIPRIIAPRKPNQVKSQTYECGIETVGDTWVQFRIQYYIFALIFLIFDVETVFLFPWAVAFDQLPMYAVLEGILFILILIAGLVYAWRKGMLEWF